MTITYQKGAAMQTKENGLAKTREEVENETLEIIFRLTDEQITALMKAFTTSEAKTPAPAQEIA